MRRAALVLAMILMAAGQGTAGPLLHPHQADCPPPSYSPCHYWTPALYRANAIFHSPRVPMYAPDRVPGIPPTSRVIKYPCPAVDPAIYSTHRNLAP